MSKSSKEVTPSVAYHDFYKTNGDDASRAPFVCEGPSMTRQEFMEECDINTIMARYDAYLSDPMRSIREPQYIDFTVMPDDLIGVMNQLNEASDAFYRLPALVRREFDNNPVLFADFACDPGNLEQMREWGLAPPAKAPEPPMRVEVVNPAPPEKPPGDDKKPDKG